MGCLLASLQQAENPALSCCKAEKSDRHLSPHRNKFQVMPGGGYVTVEIRLPENWNDLVSLLGYGPLESYYLDDGQGR